MFTLGPLGFVTPWLLWGLVALPILWLLLRAVPPAPIRRRFPGVALLLGLKDEDAETDKTPWWLLLLRMAAVAAVIAGFAGPILNPEPKASGNGPLLVVLDGGWADARDWARRVERAGQLLQDAGRDGRTVAVIRLTDAPQDVVFQTADAWAGRVAAMEPAAWAPRALQDWAEKLPAEGFDTVWLSDGLAHEGREALAAVFQDKGALSVIESPRPLFALHPAGFEDGKVVVRASRLPAGDPVQIEVLARGPDPAGITRELARTTLSFAAGMAQAEAVMDMPPELRNRVQRFEIAGLRNAGAVSLTDDSLKRRKVALIAPGPAQEGLQLLSPTHYLRQALAPVADLIEGSIQDAVLAGPDVVILADVARLAPAEQVALEAWVEKGGLLLRFAGPRMAASDLARGEEDPLLPVRLREGGRTVGGAMSWGEPKKLAPFPETSPFFGLSLPDDVEVREQILAQPDPDLSERTIAALQDGTPLVTRKALGEGSVVLVHVTANAEWSSLPLSGLFVQMLERLAVSTRPASPEAGDLAGQVWVPELVLDVWGAEQDAGTLAGVEGEVLAQALAEGPGPAQPPGLYAGADRRVALNVIGAGTQLQAAVWPAGVAVEGLAAAPEQSLKGP
uniref:BatA domain-containing protein n=1 Tax=Xinfangfangia pollutisoli TaxID=2865960 RepID=UPI001CD4E86F